MWSKCQHKAGEYEGERIDVKQLNDLEGWENWEDGEDGRGLDDQSDGTVAIVCEWRYTELILTLSPKLELNNQLAHWDD